MIGGGRGSKRATTNSRRRHRAGILFAGMVVLVVAGTCGWETWATARAEHELLTLLVRALGAERAKLVQEEGEIIERYFDVVPDLPGRERVLAVSLPPDRGWVLVGPAGGAPGASREAWTSEELARVRRVEAVQVVQDPAVELAVSEEYDARVGALSFIRQIRFLKWDGKGLRTIWKRTVWEETYSPDPPYQRRLTREAQVNWGTGVKGDRGEARGEGEVMREVIRVEEIEREYRRRDDSVQYDLERETTSGERYSWSPEEFRFARSDP